MEGRRRRSSSCPPRPIASMPSAGKAALGLLLMSNFSRLSNFWAGRLYALRLKPNFVVLAISCI
jgi:hypothetical protein